MAKTKTGLIWFFNILSSAAPGALRDLAFPSFPGPKFIEGVFQIALFFLREALNLPRRLTDHNLTIRYFFFEFFLNRKAG